VLSYNRDIYQVLLGKEFLDGSHSPPSGRRFWSFITCKSAHTWMASSPPLWPWALAGING